MADPTLVLDASAFLALVLEEPGAETVLAALDAGAGLGAVNLAEVLEVAVRRGLDAAEAAAWPDELGIRVIPFAPPMAAQAARLLGAHRRRGLSLGDCACLGTARVLGLPVLTADRLWAELDPGVEIRLIR